MVACDIVVVVLITAGVTSLMVSVLYWRAFRNLRRKCYMLQRLLREQAELREMSLEAYTTMLKEAQRHMGG